MTTVIAPKRRSVSQYVSYLQCGERYRLQRVVGIKESPSMWLPAGTAFHYATEVFDKHRVEGWNDSTSKYVDLYLDSFEQAVLDSESESGVDRDVFQVSGVTKDRPRGEDYAWWVENGSQQVLDYITWATISGYKPMVIDGKPAVELEFNLMLGDVPILGYIDNVYEDPDGYPLVVDKKTGKSQPTALQLGVYACALRECYGLEVKRGAFYMSRKGALSAPKWLGFLANTKVLTTAFGQMDYAERYGIYVPNISGDCVRCFVKDYCGYYQETLG